MKMKLEFEFPDKLMNEIKDSVSKDPVHADDIINDSLTLFMGGEYPGGDTLGNVIIDEIKKFINIDKNKNFSDRLNRCFSSSSFWSALNKEFKSIPTTILTNENGLVTIRDKDNSGEYCKFSYIDNGDQTISIDIGKINYGVIHALVVSIYDAAMNSGFKFVKFTDNSNDKELKKCVPELIKYLKDTRRNMFSWK